MCQLRKVLVNRFNEFLENPIEWGMFLVCVLLLPIDLYQFIDSGFMIQPLFWGISDIVFMVSMLFVGQKCIAGELLIMALCYGQSITFDNYTPFFMICFVCVLLKNKLKKIVPVLLLYGIDIVIVCMRHGKTPLHLVRHFIICFVIYFVFLIFIYYVRHQIFLDLTEEERQILEVLAVDGKKQKEVKGYCQNTVAKKIAKCRKKNNCKSNADLYQRYKVEKQKSINNPQNSNICQNFFTSMFDLFDLQ